MTSTSTFSGDSSSKPSSRVLRPPGGGSSIMFGGEEPAPQRKEAPAKQAEPKAESRDPISGAGRSAVSSHQHGPVATGNQLHSNETTVTKPQSVAPSTGVGQSYARANKTCGYNPITGEAYSNTPTVAPPAAAKETTTSIVVKQPPGGASTKLW